MNRLIAELGDVVREFKKKNPTKKLADLEVLLSRDEEGNSFYNEIQIAWTNDERTELTFYPMGRPVEDAE